MAKKNQSQAHSLSLTSINRGAENILHWTRSAVVRGGRMTKHKGVVASYSPELGLVTYGSGQTLVAGGEAATLTLGLARRLLRWSVAPVALFAGASPAFAPASAQAQDACVEVSPDTFVCQDNGGPATSEQLLGDGDGDIVITLEDGFEIDTIGVVNANGIEVDGNEASIDSVMISQESGTSTIVAQATGISLQSIAGNVDVTTGGDVTGIDESGIRIFGNNNGRNAGVFLDTRAGSVRGGRYGISVINGGLLGTTITTADVTGANNAGIDVFNSSGDVVIDTTAGVVIGGENGVNVRTSGAGDVTIITGDVDGEDGDGINIDKGAAAGDVVVDTTAGAVTSFNYGVDVDHDGNGDISITTGDVTAEISTGIRVSGDGGNIAIDSTAGTVDGGQGGIVVNNNRATLAW